MIPLLYYAYTPPVFTVACIIVWQQHVLVYEKGPKGNTVGTMYV